MQAAVLALASKTMNLSEKLLERCQSKCELCTSIEGLQGYEIPANGGNRNGEIAICQVCLAAMENREKHNTHHWRCLASSMWSEIPAVQVMSWRLLKKLANEDWAQDLIEQLYLDEETLQWAEAGLSSAAEETAATAKDSNGTILQTGDSVTLIKDLEVKGANFTAKRGTLVKNISLTNNPEHVEGKVNGSVIVLKTMFLKKT